MLYLDYGRKHGEWIPNRHGGRENLEAIDFLRFLNETVYRDFPDVQTIAEESTAWPQVSRPTYVGGLGFGMKWNMGWMHDTLRLLQARPGVPAPPRRADLQPLVRVPREFRAAALARRVVHGKPLSSAACRATGSSSRTCGCSSAMWTHPGKKLLFMGGEFGQRREWTHEDSLEWHVLEVDPRHEGVQRWVADLNKVYAGEPSLHAKDFSRRASAGCSAATGKRACCPSETGARQRAGARRAISRVAAAQLPGRRAPGRALREILNSDAEYYGGSGAGNYGGADAQPMPYEEYSQSLTLTLPPLAMLVFKPE